MANGRDLKGLESVLQSIDRKGYGAYERIEGSWEGEGFTLYVDRVQRDPFATPTRVRLRIPHKVAHIPRDLREERPRKVATEDFCCGPSRARRGTRPASAVRDGRAMCASMPAGRKSLLARVAR